MSSPVITMTNVKLLCRAIVSAGIQLSGPFVICARMENFCPEQSARGNKLAVHVDSAKSNAQLTSRFFGSLDGECAGNSSVRKRRG